MRTASICLVAASALALACGSATAQKANDTLRIAINDPAEVLSPYDRPNEEIAPFYTEIYQTFLRRNEHTNTLFSDFAKSWKRIDSTTLEFELRDDVMFHSGNKFSADDIVYTLNWAADPKIRLPNKGTFLLFDRAEKVGPSTVRIKTKNLYAADLTALAYRVFMLDSQVHKALENKADYGRTAPVTTGPYKVVSLDATKSAAVEERMDHMAADIAGAAGDEDGHRSELPQRAACPGDPAVLDQRKWDARLRGHEGSGILCITKPHQAPGLEHAALLAKV